MRNGLFPADIKNRQAEQWLARLEYENALRALESALAAQTSILKPYCMVSQHPDDSQDSPAGLALAEKVMASLER
jgi:hypothetical protein